MAELADLLRLAERILPGPDEITIVKAEISKRQASLDVMLFTAQAGAYAGVSSPELNLAISATMEEIEELGKLLLRLRAMPKGNGKTIKFRRYQYHHEEKKVGIKSVSSELDEAHPMEYPRLMIYRGADANNGLIAIFQDDLNAIVVRPGVGGKYAIGQLVTSIKLRDFSYYTGTVTLQNDGLPL